MPDRQDLVFNVKNLNVDRLVYRTTLRSDTDSDKSNSFLSTSPSTLSSLDGNKQRPKKRKHSENSIDDCESKTSMSNSTRSTKQEADDLKNYFIIRRPFLNKNDIKNQMLLKWPLMSKDAIRKSTDRCEKQCTAESEKRCASGESGKCLGKINVFEELTENNFDAKRDSDYEGSMAYKWPCGHLSHRVCFYSMNCQRKRCCAPGCNMVLRSNFTVDSIRVDNFKREIEISLCYENEEDNELVKLEECGPEVLRELKEYIIDNNTTKDSGHKYLKLE